MKIAVYSGSFNPLHIGHKAIMEYLVGKMNFDMVYLVVSPQSPFKDAGLASTGRARYDAACRALERHPGLKVKAVEISTDNFRAGNYLLRITQKGETKTHKISIVK